MAEEMLFASEEESYSSPFHDPSVPGTDAGEFLRQQQVRPLSPPPLQKYLHAHLHDAREHIRGEEDLRRFVLQATENGYLDTVRKALPVLARMLERQKLLPSLPGVMAAKFKTLLDFYEGKEGILILQRDGKPRKGKEFYTPLMHACEAKEGERDVEMVALLLDKGASVDYVGGRFSMRSGHGKQTGTGLGAMHMACIQGRADVVRLLITRAQDNLLKKSLKDILNAKTLRHKWTPLMYAVREGHVEVVQLLLEYDSLDVLTTNAKGQTVLHIAGSYSQVECLQEIHTKLEATSVQELGQVEDNPYLKTDKKGYNVLHCMCSGPSGSVKILKWLFETMPHLKSPQPKGPDILNLGSKTKGYTMLLLACENGNRDMVEYLLQLEGRRVDVSACTEDGKTGLHLAAIHDYPDVAELLIKHGISLTAQDKERQAKDSETAVGGDTALHIAVRKSSLDVEEIIRSSKGAGEVLQIPNKAGETPADVPPEQTIPLEIVRLGEAVVQRYRLALRKGKKKKMPRCNLIALGEQRVGKTSLLSLLMGKEFIEDRDSTRGIDNEHVDIVDIVVESRTISSEHWKQVESKDLARGHEKQFVTSVAEEFRPHFRNEGKGGRVPPPTAKTLEGEIGEIARYLDFIEEKAKKPPTVYVPVPVKKPASGVTEKLTRALNPNAPAFFTTPKATEPPAEHKPATLRKPPTVAAKPTPQAPPETPVNLQPPRRPLPTLPPRPPKPAAEKLPPKKRNESNRRRSDISLRVGKSIVSTAKQSSKEKEPVLQYNTLDFAGQREYRAMHHCFIVRRAIYLVVFNLQTVREALDAPNEENKKALEEIQYWLNSIHAHIHKIGPEPKLKRVIMVGTHRAPKGKREITEDDMRRINDALGEKYIEDSDIMNDLRRADPKAEIWFAAVENSIDQPEKSARKKSGARSVQEAIHQAWDDLPFKTDKFPTTWLRFEAFLNRKRDTAIVKVDTVRRAALDYGIGEDDEKDIDIALGFFHDTGTIVYLKKLPTLYLNVEEKKVLDDLVLLDPTWLTKVMRTVMELKLGTGSSLTNAAMRELKKTATADASLLRQCWKEFTDEVFHQLCLMLQSFCLIFPLPQSESLPPERSSSTPASSPSAERGSGTRQINRSQSEGQPPAKPVTTYLIPSMLPEEPRPTDETLKKLYNFSFSFDFRGFLPVEVYHRLLCLMMRDQKKEKTRKSKDIFTAEFFQVKCIQECNWMVQRIDSKLRVFVKCPPNHKVPPSTHVSFIHIEYLRKICNEQANSLQGLKYIGGPEHTCACEQWKGVVPCVAYPEEIEIPSNWRCDECLNSFKVDLLLNPDFKEKDVHSNVPPHNDGPSGGECKTEGNGATGKNAGGNTVNIHANHVVIGEPGSTINVQPYSSGLEIPMANLMVTDGPPTSTSQQIGTPTQQRAAIPSPAASPASIRSQAASLQDHSATQEQQPNIPLGIDDLQKVLEALVDVNKQWRKLGLALGLRKPVLTGIETAHANEDCKEEMLTKWLEQVDGCSPSWNELVEALRKPTVLHLTIADKIEQKYLA